MSAFQVGEAHIGAMVRAFLALDTYRGSAYWGERRLTADDAPELCKVLAEENDRSYFHRYPQATAEGDKHVTIEHADDLANYAEIDAMTWLKAIDCYEYQACEHDGWTTSKAHDLCAAMRRRAVQQLPGWNDARGWPIYEWGRELPTRGKPIAFPPDEEMPF